LSTITVTLILKDKDFTTSMKKATKCLDNFRIKANQCKKELTSFQTMAVKTSSALAQKNTILAKQALNQFTSGAKKKNKDAKQDDNEKKEKSIADVASGLVGGVKTVAGFAKAKVISGVNFLSDMENQLGLADKENSFTSMMGNLKNTYYSTIAQMMGVSKNGETKVGGVFDSMKNIIKSVTDLLTKWSNDGTIESISAIFAGGMNLIAIGVSWVIENIEWLIPIVGGLAASLATLSVINTVSGAMTAAKGIMDIWKSSTFAQTLATQGLNTALRANPLGLIITGIGIAVAAGIALYRNWDTIKKGACELGISIKNTFKSAINQAINWINLLIEKANIVLKFFGKEIPTIQKFELEPSLSDATVNNTSPGGNALESASGINRSPQQVPASQIRKDATIVSARNNPSAPNTETPGVNGTNNVTININGYNKSTKEIVNELVPPLKLALANM